MKILIAIVLVLACGIICGHLVGYIVNFKMSPLWAVPFAALFLLGAAAGAWPLMPR